MRPVEDRQPAVGIFVHPHRGAHKMRPQRARRDLQGEAVPLDGIVVADAALLLDAQDLARAAGAVGDESAVGFDRSERKSGVVGRPITFGEPAIGRRDRV